MENIIFSLIYTAVLFILFKILIFGEGEKAIRNYRKGFKDAVDTIDGKSIEAVEDRDKKNAPKKKRDTEQERTARLLANIDNYSGDGSFQKEV